MEPWHSRPASDLTRLLGADLRRGLTEEEARRRLEKYGGNRLAQRPPRSLLLRLADQLRDPMILVLLAAAGLSLLSSGGRDRLDSLIILLIVAVNAVISISQESSAQKALAALRALASPRAGVIRDGRHLRVPAEEVVPGDLIELEAGDLVPADARLVQTFSFKTDESAMTGESLPVEKDFDCVLPAGTALGDRRNMVISSTVVTAGRARSVVTATGMDSEVGRIAALLLDQPELETPLQQGIAQVSKALSFLCLCVCAVTFAVGLLQGRSLPEMFMTAVSLAVAAIPEGLPAVVTIVLALGVEHMAKQGAIVKKLPAVETLGCAGVICSDKTGTLTRNKMTVRRLWVPPGGSEKELLTAAVLCCDAALSGHTASGDPTETAIVEYALARGLSKPELEASLPRRGELPFDSERKLMSTLHRRREGGYLLCVKGAPDVLLSRCALSDARRRAALRENDAMAKGALRVLAAAVRELPALPAALEPQALERELTFLGLIGMMDPPRPESGPAVAQCRRAGIRPVMITGDHRLTAVATARELDICREGDLALTGEELDFMPQALLERDIERISVYARVSPEHKTRIVAAWQKRGAVVAMTGDGINDAPALRAAHIGCAMGRSGTEVAKEAADMILTDDNFATVVSAVAQGRGVYANIRKAIHYLLSCNIGEILTVFLATVLGLRQMPLVPVQLLWLNLVTDSLPALALGVEPAEEGIMDRPPRDPSRPLFDRAFSLRLCAQGVMVGALSLLAYVLGGYVLSPAGQGDGAANTMAFATLTLCQLFHAYNVRSEDVSLFRLGVFSNRAMNRAFLTGVGMQLAVLLLPPLRTVFKTVPMTPVQWGAVLGLSLMPVVLCEGEKYFRGRKGKAPSG